MNVFVVDDNTVDLLLASTLLSMSGHRVQQLLTAEAALELIEKERPDVLLIDLRLPGISGTTLIRMLKSDARTRSIPIVAASAYPELCSPDNPAAADWDACLIKPFNTRELVRQLEQLGDPSAR